MTETASSSIGITKDELGKKYGRGRRSLSGNTIRQTMASCGLNTSKRSYSLEEEEKFKVARKMIEEDGKTYREVSEFFKVDVEDVSSGNSDNFFENQATEASGSGEVSFELANAIAQTQATQVADMIPPLTMYHLNQILDSNGQVNDKMRSLVDRIRGMRGNSHVLMMQGIQRLEAKQLAAANGGNGSAKKLKPASTAKKTSQAALPSGETPPPPSSTTSTPSSAAKSSDSATQ
ncbi:hypothetical protein [Lyngbya confervoides]|uniref:Uncharacterized protein n=1 Tax=Lyngbya confervoides BDU141951 TaxID=1574623 RepID=A0ABD4T7H0_9CYAN|nr:hypothetical protein [Lyngbya confervoides]MCM1984435.1 hypothetical protein [Lyngbya confervoides BDU141951]